MSNRRWALAIAAALPMGGFAGVGALAATDWYVSFCARDHIYTDVNALAPADVGLVLGTSKFLDNGRENLYFRYRMDAAEALYRAGKVKHLLVSGDNGTVRYDEPTAMQQDLIARGIPQDHITMDFAGFRTLDSVVRAKEVFGQHRFIIVSQRFHNERALYIASSLGIDAVAFDAADVNFKGGLKTRLREVLARTKALLDVHVLGTRPRFGGEPVPITID